MTKKKIYIDFEAISSPFNRASKLPQDVPYAYSIGLYKGKKFKSKTFIFNFTRDNVAEVNDIMRFRIMDDIRELMNDRAFKVNKSTIMFVGWAPNLEKKILDKMFKGIDVVDQNTSKGDMSLSRITHKEFEDNYFPEFKKRVAEQIDPKFVEKRHLFSDGALAALAGHILYNKVHNRTKKFIVDIDTQVLIKELVAYSKDDVVRMAFVNDNPALINKRIERFKELLIKKNKIKSSINRNERFLKKLETFNEEISVKELKDEIKKMLKEKNDEYENVTNDFNNK